MTTETRATRYIHAAPTEVMPPSWVTRIFEDASWSTVSTRDGRTLVQFVTSYTWALTKVTFPVLGVSREGFEQSVFRAYRELLAGLLAHRAQHPVRLWVFIPNIRTRMGSKLDRYNVFNSGRYAAFVDWLGGFEQLGVAPAGTCVGLGQADFTLYCLSSTCPGTSVGNPRQIPPYCYSKRYGPKPPCFARATSIQTAGKRPTLLVGGTASICGEKSFHDGNVTEQTRETFRNLAAVAQSAFARPSSASHEGWLDVYRHLRVYYLKPSHLETITNLVTAEPFRHVAEVEFVQANLCRPELLVEIEGFAKVS